MTGARIHEVRSMEIVEDAIRIKGKGGKIRVLDFSYRLDELEEIKNLMARLEELSQGIDWQQYCQSRGSALSAPCESRLPVPRRRVRRRPRVQGELCPGAAQEAGREGSDRQGNRSDHHPRAWARAALDGPALPGRIRPAERNDIEAARQGSEPLAIQPGLRIVCRFAGLGRRPRSVADTT